MKKNRFLITLVMLAFTLAPMATQAASLYLNAGELDWNEGASWTGGSVPDINTDASVRAYVDGNYGGTAARTAVIQSAVPGQYIVFAQNDGQIKVTDGGVVNVNNSTVVHNGGKMLIEGTGIYNAIYRFYVGSSGWYSDPETATVNLTGGELNTSNVILLGDGANAEGTVNVSGGVWTIDGGDALRLATQDTTAKGTITLSGAGMILNSRDANPGNPAVPNNRLTIGYNGEGTFTQTGGEYEAFHTGNGLRLSEVAGSSGSYSISGGVLDLSIGASVTAGSGTARFEVNGIWDEAGVTDEIDIGGDFLLNTADSTLAYKLSLSGIEQIMVGGDADLSNATLDIGYTSANLTAGVYNLLNAGGTITTTGVSLQNNLPSGYFIEDWGVSAAGSQTLWVNIGAIPEPSSVILLILGGVMLRSCRRK